MALAGLSVVGSGCNQKTKDSSHVKTDSDESEMKQNPVKTPIQISLAEWSLHRTLNGGEMTNLDFARVTKETYKLDGLEYVSRFFDGQEKDKKYLDQLNQAADDHSVQQLLIMVDGEGGLAELDKKVLATSIENHYKWVEAAQYLGCHSIRVNAYGKGTAEEMHSAAVEGLGQLATFAKDFNIQVIVENHGGLSSNGKWLSNVMKSIDMDNCGTLPDFGNFCIERADGKCIEEYDRYTGVKELMPYAKAVSAKTYDFDIDGNCIETDYTQMIKLVKDAQYTGFIGIEYEGNTLSEHDGILATKALLQKVI